ncbi:neuropeptides capa receptor-like [Patiria miniata]|uniref:G-protein coupled receptors family 1 profile domain-containing protein n=1 Tax=Patiria miniata TaxID=46514 RepID=A0A913YYS6_PATMI|nr:neuropeptides capa receptor-like [Patiria miniata]XP_038044548.1 neuropeptides capa receptor-like [Patiria miniata]
MSEEFITGVRYALTVCAVVAAVANLLVLVVFARTSRLRMKYYGLLINLTLADLFYAVMAIAFTWGESDLLFLIFISGYFVGVWTILAEAVNRYLALTFVDTARYDELVTRNRLVGICALIWVVSFAVEILPAYLAHEDVYHIIEGVVKPLVVFAFWLITAGLYFVVFRKIRRYTIHLATSSPPLQKPTEDHQVRTRLSQIRRLLVTFMLILVTSFVCWMPFSVIQMVQFFHGDLENLEAAYWMSGAIYCLAPLINPFIYWLRLDGFREGWHQMFCGCFEKESSPNIEAENTISETGL